MNWYKMCKNMESLKTINSNFEDWRKSVDENDLDKEFDNKLVEIAENNGFRMILKTDTFLFFTNHENEVLIAWHNSHEGTYSINDCGFNINLKKPRNMGDIINFYHEGLINNKELVELFLELNEINMITEKQQKSLLNIFEYCKLKETEKNYFDKPYSPEDYQNVYHNIWNNKKLQQKIIIRDFLEVLGFFN